MSFPPLYHPEESAEFMALKPKVRAKAWQRYDAAKAMHAAGKKRQVATCRAIAESLGCDWKSLYVPARRFIADPHWTALVDRRYHSAMWLRKSMDSGALPAEFISFWHDLVLAQHRCVTTAYRLLMIRLAAWRAGDGHQAIPGFIVPPPNAPGKRHPRKMSCRDLRRNLPSDVEMEATKHGRAAAMALLPAIRTTRKGGYPGMEVQFDDRWIDVEAVYGKDSINRVLEFAAVEYYSGYHFAPWLRPRVNIDGVNKSLSERDFRLYAVHFAATIGWSPRGTVYRGERGMCAFRGGLHEKLARHSNGGIMVAEPGMSGQAAYVGGFAELAKGNPNAKALKEGMGGLLHNLLGGLMGQSGSSPSDRPAGHVGREAETRALLALQGHIARPLTLAHHTFEQVCEAIFRIYEIANLRHDHNCEGWLDEGLVLHEFCADQLRDLWLPVSSLDEHQRHAISILGGSLGDLIRPRPMNPAEVLRPAMAGFQKLTPEAVADCIYEDVRRQVSVTNGEVSFRDAATYGHRVFRYPATFQRTDGFRRTLPNGEDIYLVVHPAMADTGFFFDLDGCYLGKVARNHAIARADADSIKRAIGHKVARYNDATLAMQVRAGLRRANTLTDNAAALIDGIRADVMREHGLGITAGRQDSAPSVSISELLPDADESADDPPASAVPSRESSPTPASILLGNY